MHSHGFSGRHFAMNHNTRSNRGGLRRGQQRASYVHRLNSERRGTRTASTGTRGTTATTGTRGTTAASTGTTGSTTATTGTGTGTTGGGSGGERR
jgi:hypothetical protein